VVVLGVIAGVLVATRNYGDVSAGASSSDALDPSSSPVPSQLAVAAPTTLPDGPTAATGTVTAVVGDGRWTVSVGKGLSVTVVTTLTTTLGKGADDVTTGTVVQVTGTVAAGVLTATTVDLEKDSSSSSSSSRSPRS
jgi:hypothetical protein